MMNCIFATIKQEYMQSHKFQYVEQTKTAVDLMVGGCAVSCHVGAKCGYFEK